MTRSLGGAQHALARTERVDAIAVEHGRHLLQRLFAAHITEFVFSDLSDLVADWTYYTYRACAEESPTD